jgi:hypothetical protein
MDNKQTAVEWLVSQILKEKKLLDLDIEAAKEMEKQQIMQSYSDGLGNGIAIGNDECSMISCCDEEQYYNQTFKK